MTDDALLAVDQVDAHGRLGPTELAVRASLAAGALEDRDAGAGELAAQLARAVDVAQRVRRDPYAVATAGRELREQLARLRLDPVSRDGNDAGELATWLQQLGSATSEQDAG